jgi:hypothetical protein
MHRHFSMMVLVLATILGTVAALMAQDAGAAGAASAQEVLPRPEKPFGGKIDIPATGADGVMLCLGTEFGGWSLFVNESSKFEIGYIQK